MAYQIKKMYICELVFSRHKTDKTFFQERILC